MVQKNHTDPYLSKFTYSCSARQNPLVESAVLTAWPNVLIIQTFGQAVKSTQISHLQPVCYQIHRLLVYIDTPTIVMYDYHSSLNVNTPTVKVAD